jgi:hypothetical protein
MKKNILCLCLCMISAFVHAQNGLECIVVEKYYVSDVNDSIGNDAVSINPGTLPVGSVTYRVYADMLQGYKFQGVYGVDSVPISGPLSPGDHELRLETSTLFFNNEDRGATTPNAINNNYVSHNTVMLDSWLSVGAASSTKYGIMKSEDDGASTVVNIDGLLQNNDASAGIALTINDGLITGTPAANQVTLVGFSPTELDVFDNTTNGNLLSTFNATWASLGGSKGPDTVSNKVLIGQFTTNGTFSFKLNVQVGTPTGEVQNFVAENPVNNEIMLPCLTFNSDSLATGIAHHATDLHSSFILYPNPATDALSILVNTAGGKSVKAEYKIIDITGKIIISKELGLISGKFIEHADISTLHAGVYFVEVTQDGIASHKKVIKN